MKKFIILALVGIFLLTGVQTVFAQGGFGLDKTGAAAGYETTGDSASLAPRIQLVVSVILGFVAVIFFALTLYGGIIWLTARGKEEKVSEAKSILEAAAIGLAVIGASYAIATFVVSRLNTGSNVAEGKGSCVIRVSNTVSACYSNVTEEQCDSLFTPGGTCPCPGGGSCTYETAD